MVLHPVGPLPPRVYWWRRVILLAAVLLVVALLAWACGGGGDSSSSAAAGRPSGSPRGSLGPAAAAGSASPAAGPASPAAGPASSATAPTGSPRLAACEPAQLSVAAGADRQVYPGGVQPQLSMTVRNTGAAPCRVAVGSGHTDLVVVSGSDRIWARSDCGGSPARQVVLTPGATEQLVAVTWARRRSAPGCPSTGPTGQAALPGTYRVTARLDGQTSPPAVFHLTG